MRCSRAGSGLGQLLQAGSGIARFAQRMAPATCVALDHGASLTLESGCVKRAAADRLTPDGTVELDWNGWA